MPGHRREAFSRTLDWALRLVLIIAFPAALGLIVLAEPLLATIFYGGAFTADDVNMAEAALIAYALGLLGFILVKVLTPGYFARQDTKTPVRIAVYALILNMAPQCRAGGEPGAIGLLRPPRGTGDGDHDLGPVQRQSAVPRSSQAWRVFR